ncbi:MAG: glycosyltransferase, partial [Blastocatellia bacterium]
IYTDSFSRLVVHGEASKADVVYGNCDYTDGQGRFVYSLAAAQPAELLPLFRKRCMGFAQQSAIFRRCAYQQLGGFDESFVYRGDGDFYVRGLLAGLKFAHLKGPSVACFRLHQMQFSNRGLSLTEVEADRIFNKPEMKVGLSDQLVFAGWRLKNLPHYLIRIVRESLLSNRLRFPRSIETYTHR